MSKFRSQLDQVREKILLNRKKIVGEIIFDYDKADKELSNALSINIKE